LEVEGIDLVAKLRSYNRVHIPCKSSIRLPFSLYCLAAVSKFATATLQEELESIHFELEHDEATAGLNFAEGGFLGGLHCGGVGRV